MATERLAMHQAREILRQKLTLKRSHREVMVALCCRARSLMGSRSGSMMAIIESDQALSPWMRATAYHRAGSGPVTWVRGGMDGQKGMVSSCSAEVEAVVGGGLGPASA
jgi:hypothetical protein